MVCLKDGFDTNHIYELVYTAKNPTVAGIGFAATRDFNSLSPRLAPPPFPNDGACRIQRASQSQIKFADQFVVVELVGRAALESDLAVHDNIAAVSDPNCLVKVLLGHQHG